MMRAKTLFPAILLLGCFILFSSQKNQPKKFKKIKLPKSWVYVPSGTLLTGPIKKDVEPRKISVMGFFMLETEVSNLDYREFLNDLKIKGRTEDYEIAKHSPEKWGERSSYGEPFVENYHQHPAYDNYPVLTISKKGAEMYCDWLEDVFEKKHEGYVFDFRLPTEHEWVYAARGGNELAPYSWGGFYLRNAKGQYLCNFKRISESNIHFNTKTQEYEIMSHGKGILENVNIGMTMPAPAKSYFPNDYGLYNMCGNAAEMISSPANRTKGGSYNSTGYDIAIEGPDQYEGWTEPSPFIGFRPIMTFHKK